MSHVAPRQQRCWPPVWDWLVWAPQPRLKPSQGLSRNGARVISGTLFGVTTGTGGFATITGGGLDLTPTPTHTGDRDGDLAVDRDGTPGARRTAPLAGPEAANARSALLDTQRGVDLGR